MKTPQIPVHKLSAALSIANDVWLKREDLHKYGSHKGRSIPLMISTHHKAGAKDFVISSSGNAALAALLAVQAHNNNKPTDPLTLTILVGQKIDANKLQKLTSTIADPRVAIKQVENPKQTAFEEEKSGTTWLRQSTDDVALVGYAELASELAKIENLSAIFIPTSSGTTAEGLGEAFIALGKNPEIHIIQTTTCHPMVEGDVPEEISLAGAIVDKVAHRKEKVVSLVQSSGGAGWIATNSEIQEARELIKKTSGIDVSPNSALSVAGLTKAIKAKKSWSGPVVCLITGR